MTAKEAAKRVERGIALLDQDRAHWWEDVDLETLDMSDPSTCLIGQLYGDFMQGYEHLDYERGWAWEYGFDIPCEGGDADYVRLHRAWAAAINSRKVAV